MKSNPLFHDSSVSQDSNVQTKFELMGLKTLSGDRVFMRLELDSEVTFYEMNFNEDSALFETSVWLKHRKELLYTFLVKRGDSWVSATTARNGHAMHSLLDHWVDLKSDELEMELKRVNEVRSLKFVELSEKEQENSESEEEFYDNLIKKWDL